jgi:hypothetical protein
MCVAIAAVIEGLFLFLFRETYEPTILKCHAQKKRKDTSDDSWTTEHEEQDQGATATILQSMARPARIIWSSSLLQCLSLWGGLALALFYGTHWQERSTLQTLLRDLCLPLKLLSQLHVSA